MISLINFVAKLLKRRIRIRNSRIVSDNNGADDEDNAVGSGQAVVAVGAGDAGNDGKEGFISKT